MSDDEIVSVIEQAIFETGTGLEAATLAADRLIAAIDAAVAERLAAITNLISQPFDVMDVEDAEFMRTAHVYLVDDLIEAGLIPPLSTAKEASNEPG